MALQELHHGKSALKIVECRDKTFGLDCMSSSCKAVINELASSLRYPTSLSARSMICKFSTANKEINKGK